MSNKTFASIKKIVFIKAGAKEIEKTWLAPYAEQEAFVINDEYLIIDDEVHDFDAGHYSKIFKVLNKWD